MTLADRERLLRRIRQIRRAAGTDEQQTSGGGALQPDALQPDPLDALAIRVAHLEELLQGLQDSVHREAERHSRMIAELQALVEPQAMGAALAEDARQRGL
jgi:hypothetical protein